MTHATLIPVEVTVVCIGGPADGKKLAVRPNGRWQFSVIDMSDYRMLRGSCREVFYVIDRTRDGDGVEYFIARAEGITDPLRRLLESYIKTNEDQRSVEQHQS